MKRQFCLPCFLEIKKAGKHDIERRSRRREYEISIWFPPPSENLGDIPPHRMAQTLSRRIFIAAETHCYP